MNGEPLAVSKLVQVSSKENENNAQIWVRNRDRERVTLKVHREKIWMQEDRGIAQGRNLGSWEFLTRYKTLWK